MLTKYVEAGNKLDIRKMTRERPTKDKEDKEPVYRSRVYEVISDTRVEVIMPMEKGKLVLLPLDSEYDLCFLASSGRYQCQARLLKRYKKKNAYLLLFELASGLRKSQRRDYYRYNVNLELGSRVMEPDDMERVGQAAYDFSEILTLGRSVIADISGGGLRFVANFAYQKDDMIHCRFKLKLDGTLKEYNLVAKVLQVHERLGHSDVFEHRVQFVVISAMEREEIIRYIFEEERQKRKKG